MKPEGMPKNIHIVEDQLPLQKLLEITLQHQAAEQYNISFSTSVAEATAHMNEQVPDLVILNIHLSGMENGLNFLQQLRQNEQTQQLPVIVITADDDPTLQQVCTQLGVSAYLLKPFDLQPFKNAVTGVFTTQEL